MMNVIKFYNNEIKEENENLYLHFNLGGQLYAINVLQVVEIIKMPMLDYPQKLGNNIVGLLNYNNFTINILDLRFYLDIKVTPYSTSNQLIIVKTDESIFGLIVDYVENILPLDESKVEYFPIQTENKLIDFLYKNENKTASVVNLSAVEQLLKQGTTTTEQDIQALFPQDDASKYKLIQRHKALQEKYTQNANVNIFAQDKYIAFSIARNLFCININYAKEFIKNASITNIPCDLDYIAGLITFRGDFVAVVDFKKFLEIPGQKPTIIMEEIKNNIIIIETEDFKIGFLVDKIYDIIEISEELISQNAYKQSKYVQSEVLIENNLYTILNMKNILSDEKLYIEENI